MKKLYSLALCVLASWTMVNPVRAQYDIGITGATSPVDGCVLPCTSPTILVYNYGSTIFVGNYQFCYQVNGGPTICETLSIPSFNNGAVYTYTFVQQACFPTQGTYNFTFTANIMPATGTDINLPNNTFLKSIVNDTIVVPGTLVQSDSVCQGTNSGVLTLTGNTGYYDYWEASTDGGSTWTNVGGATATYSYSNLTQTTIFHHHIEGQFCPDGWSPWAVITTVPPPIPGTAVSNQTVCSGTNSGSVSLTGYTGNIVNWMMSTDGGATWSPTGLTTPTINFNNLTQTTTYYAQVGNGGFCSNDVSSQVTITAAPPTIAGSVVSDATVCSGSNSDSVALIGNTGNVLFWVQSTNGGATWTPLGNTTTLQGYVNLTTTTMYAAVVQNGICPQDTSAFATITVQPTPVVNAGPDSTINQGDVLCFGATGALIYTWTPPTYLDNPGAANPCMTATTVGTITYTVMGADAFGCIGSDQVTITVLDTTTIFPPQVANFITPNGDGLNDVWNVMNIGFYPDNEVTVWNNHGQEVFHKTGYNNDWDGTYNGDALPDGSYYYVVKINVLDRTFKGVVTITDTH